MPFEAPKRDIPQEEAVPAEDHQNRKTEFAKEESIKKEE